VSLALRGNLKDFGIADVFQLIGQQRKTGQLEITRGSRSMWLAFESGSVVWGAPAGRDGKPGMGEGFVRSGLLTQEQLQELQSECQASARSLWAVLAASNEVSAQEVEEVTSLITQDTIFEVLRWRDGSFDFSAEAVPHNRPPELLLGAEQILMDGLRMADEWQTFGESVPGNERILERGVSFDLYKHGSETGPPPRVEAAEKLYQLVDGRLTWRRVIDLSRLGTFEATRILADLIDAGVVQPVERRAVDRLSGFGSPGSMLEEGWLRMAAIASLPLLVLAAVVSAGFMEHAPSSASPVFPILRSPLEDAQIVFEKRRIRHALEAYRYRFGDWPGSLSEADRTGLLGRETLAPAEGDPYYYARREGGVLLLAPER
jgi:hypothetical protein